MSETLRILQVEDSESDAGLIVRQLQKSGYVVESKRVDKAAPMRKALTTENWDVIIADYQIPQFDALEALRIRNSCARDVPFIIVSGTIGEETAVEMMRAGAQDYILKHRMVRLPAAVERETRAARARRHLSREYRNLAEQLRIQEQHVEDKKLDVEQSARENTILLQEVHHRVRNNLQMISSLLAMQINRMGNDDRFVAPLQRAHHRVLAMALVHEQLFESNVESHLNFGHYVQALSAKLYQAYSIDPVRVRFDMEIEPVRLPVDHAINCGLILNELLANALKHAFPNERTGVITFRLRSTAASARAEFSFIDNGVGLPAEFDDEESPALGLTLVRALVTQLEGDLRIHSKAGTAFTFDWNLGSE